MTFYSLRRPVIGANAASIGIVRTGLVLGRRRWLRLWAQRRHGMVACG